MGEPSVNPDHESPSLATIEKFGSIVPSVENVSQQGTNNCQGPLHNNLHRTNYATASINLIAAKRSFLKLQTRSIVNVVQGKWFTKIHEKYRAFYIFLGVIIVIFNTTHNCLMIFKLLPVPNTYPLVAGPLSTMVILILADALICSIMYLALIYRIDFTEFEYKWKTIGLSSQDPYLDSMLKQTARQVLLYGIVFLSGWTLNLIAFTWCIVTNDWDNGTFTLTMETIHILTYVLVPFFGWSKLYSLYTSSMIIRSIFTMIGRRISAQPETVWNIEMLRFYRKMYTRTIELAEASNAIWSRYLSFYYPILNIAAIVILYFIISGPSDLFRYIVLGILDFIAFWAIIFTNRYIVGINVEASSIYNIVYAKSLCRQEPDYMIEVSLFLERIGREDVGYSYEGMFVYSPRLMTSFVTLTVTIIIAFPSFMPKH